MVSCPRRSQMVLTRLFNGRGAPGYSWGRGYGDLCVERDLAHSTSSILMVLEWRAETSWRKEIQNLDGWRL